MAAYYQRFCCALIAVLLVLSSVSADSFVIRTRDNGHFYSRGFDVPLLIHVPYRPQNRKVEWSYEGDQGHYGSSEIDLTNGGNEVTHRETWDKAVKGPQIGHYVVTAVLKGVDDNGVPVKDIIASSEFEVH